MKNRTNRIITGALAGAMMCVAANGMASEKKKPLEKRPLVQLAVLLDTSGSMQGMIDQAKAQIWSIVNEFATAERDGQKPLLEVSLYHYGSPGLGVDNGYVKQLAELTGDLDAISEKLFALGTSGGDEYCGWAIQTATRQLKWSESSKDYKAIFIAGNEPFDQGKVDYREACKEAIAKGIIVNTIHCAGGEDDHWAEGATLADGRFMRIDGDRKVAEVAAPQDKELIELNAKLNQTYIGYGSKGRAKREAQVKVDSLSLELSSANLSKRASAKASAQYLNTSWDLVDAVREEEVDIEAVKDNDLPEEMRDMSVEERKAYVGEKQKERAAIQEQIRELTKERDKFVAEKRRDMAESNEDTLGNKVREAVRTQAKDKGFAFGE